MLGNYRMLIDLNALFFAANNNHIPAIQLILQTKHLDN
jgi:hypothetical protein